MKFIRDTLTTFSATIVGVVFALVANVVIARMLGAEGKGAYALVILVPTLLGLLGHLGIGQAGVYFGSTKRYGWGEIASNSFLSALCLGTLLAAGFLVYFLVAHPGFLPDVDWPEMVAALVSVPFSLLVGYFGLILMGHDRVRSYNILQVAPIAVYVALLLVLLLVTGAGVFGAVVSWTIAAAVGGVLSLLMVRRVATITWRVNPRLIKDSVRFGVPVSLGNAVQFLNYRVDMLMVASLMDVTAVGYYSVSVVVAETLWYLPSAVGTIVFARTTSLSAEEANSSTPRICRNTLFITALMGLAIAVVSRYAILLLFGSAFLPALRPLWILLPGVVVLSVWKVLPSDLVARGKTAIMPIGAGISLALNILLNILLIPRMGISGAALASTVSYTATALVILIAFLRVSNSSWVETVVLRPEDLRIYVGAIGGVSTWTRSRVGTCGVRVKRFLVRGERA